MFATNAHTGLCATQQGIDRMNFNPRTWTAETWAVFTAGFVAGLITLAAAIYFGWIG